MGLDARARQLERGHRLRVARGDGRCNLGRAYAHAGRREVEPVEPARQLDDCLVTVLAHLGDDRAHGGVDVLGDLALGDEEGRECALEVGVAGGEVEGHGSIGPATAMPSGVSRRWLFVDWVLRHRLHAPHRPQVLELGLDALHVQADGAAVGEVQRHLALRRFARLVADGEQ